MTTVKIGWTDWRSVAEDHAVFVNVRLEARQNAGQMADTGRSPPHRRSGSVPCTLQLQQTNFRNEVAIAFYQGLMGFTTSFHQNTVGVHN